MPEHSVVGKSVNNRDTLEKVTGKATYCADMALPGMLHGKVLRSTRAHARISHIDTSLAENIPGVKCIITGRDVPERKFGEVIYDKPILSRGVVRFIGDPVAAVAAETIDAADEAIRLIKVSYEDLPAIFDPEEAWAVHPGVTVHPDLFDYELGPVASAPDHRVVLDPERPNVCRHCKIRHGDIKKGFKEADEIIENRFSTARIQACTMEPHGCIAQVDFDGRLTVWSGRQLLFFSRKHLCGALDLPPSGVRLISSMHIGGSFGSKSMFTVEPIAAILARRTGWPVKIILTREEVFRTGGSRIPMVITIRDGVKRDGTIAAREVKVILNAGAYAVLAPILATNLTYALVGTYRIPHMKIDAYAVYTNEPEAISFRGFGSSQPIWAVENQMDMIAEQLGISAVDIRKKNVLNEGEENAHGEYAHSTGAKQCLEKVAKELNRSDKPSGANGWRVGRGVALGNKYCFPGVMSLGWVKVHEDGALEVRHSADNFGQGVHTVMAQIAAEVFNMPVERVRVSCGDTDNVPISTGSISQSSTYNVGKGVLLAALDAKEQVLKLASRRLDVPVEILDTEKGVVTVKSKPSVSMPITDLFKRTGAGGYIEDGGEIVGRATWAPQNAMPHPDTGQIDPDAAKKGLRRASFFGHAAQAAEVMVNMETGEVKVKKLILACDMGLPINPKLCEGQMEGGL
ncbi:MAG: xanthine dehydrogenase family protein molybdopterin-binding subunit, partial [Deltaproteobacteria bacterium]|nr:xanthine dehydrogenase family protein molybdopterin-binding subunit [Deltaproteobacteria bacterium]